MQKLEAELSNTGRERENADQLRRMALRYLALDEGIPQPERDKLLARYESSFTQLDFVVVYGRWLPRLLGQLLEKPIQDIQGNSVFILPVDAPKDIEPDVRLGQSGRHHGLAELSAACMEAAAAFRHAYFRPAPCMLIWQPPCEKSAAAADTVEDKEIQRIIHLVGVSRWQEACRQVEALTARVREGTLTPEGMERAARAIAQKLAAVYRTMLPVDQKPDLIADLWRYNSCKEYLEALSGWMYAFAQRMAHEFGDYHNKQKIHDAVEFMRSSFAQPLNMAVVSNEVSMNYSLFSLLFKQYMGSNFVSFLQTLRVEEAKRLLVQTDYRVGEIGRRVGFVDDKNFMKVFKQNTSVTPTEYRKASQLNSI